MYGLHYSVPFFIAHLHPSRAGSRFEFSDIGHAPILAHLLAKFLHKHFTNFFHKNIRILILFPLCLATVRAGNRA